MNKVTEIFIGSGAALPTGGTTIATASINQTGIYGNDMTAVTAGDTISTAGRSSIFLVNKLANGELKRSFEIKGTSVVGYKGLSYAPAKREVWAIGYNRATTTGDITVNNDTDYNFTIRFKNDKSFYSERPEVLNVTFTSSSVATQSNIADQIVSAINNSAFGSSPSGIKVIKSVKVGNGTGVYGLTGATNFGVEIWGLDVNQFSNTTYKENYVYFSVFVNDATGFESTTECAQIQAMDPGVGTYLSVYNKENFFYQFEGVLNRTTFPIPDLAKLSSSTGITSGTIAAFTVTGTISEDTVTFSAAASTQLPAGSIVLLNGTQYEIKYYVSTTVAVLTEVLSAGLAADTVAGKAWYDMYVIDCLDVVTTPGANVGQFAKKQVIIATPAIASGATNMTTQGTESSNIEDVLDPWMASTPGAFPGLSL